MCLNASETENIYVEYLYYANYRDSNMYYGYVIRSFILYKLPSWYT